MRFDAVNRAVAGRRCSNDFSDDSLPSGNARETGTPRPSFLSSFEWTKPQAPYFSLCYFSAESISAAISNW